MTSILANHYVPKRLNLWTYPGSYMGPSFDDYYVFLGQNRDSDSITRSNFTCGLRDIGGATGEFEDEHTPVNVAVINQGHWAVGWIEWIAIHKTNGPVLRKADEILRKLEDYPVVDDDHLSQLEWDEAAESWEHCSIRDRIEYLARWGLSIFAARRDELPEDDDGRVLETLRG